MFLSPGVPGDVAEIVKQHPWLKHYIAVLAGISSTSVSDGKNCITCEFMKECIRQISVHSWERLRMDEVGLHFVRSEPGGDIHSHMRYAVIYRESDGSIKHQDYTPGKNKTNLLPSPRAIIDDLKRTALLEGKNIQVIAVVKFDCIFKIQEKLRSFSLAVYCFPENP